MRFLVDIFYYLVHYPYAVLLIPIVIWICNGLRTPRTSDRVLLASSIAAIAISGVVLITSFAEVTRNDWSADRLAPTISWMRGERLYYPPGQGPVLTRFYGPVASLVYTPAALARTPTGALLIGGGINLAFFLLPAFWLIRKCTSSRTMTVAALAAFAVVVAANDTLMSVARMVTSDAPAIGFAACAAAALIHSNRANPIRTGLICGILAGLSVWSKQTLAPVVPALLGYAAITGNTRWSLKFGAAMLALLAILSAAILLAIGPHELLFNMVTLPSSRPWQRPWLSGAAPVTQGIGWIWRDFLLIGWLFVAGIVLAEISSALRAAASQPARATWRLPAILALLLLPGCAYAYAQVGGQGNSGSPVAYFALLAALAALAHVAEPNGPTSLPLPARLARTGMICLLIGSCVAISDQWRSLPSRLAIWTHLRENRQEQAVRYARLHPGTVYFPTHPLVAMYAENRTYHFSDGVYCLHLAGRTLAEPQLSAALPPNLNQIIIPDEHVYLPEELAGGFTQITRSQDLPGWVILSRPDNPQPPNNEPGTTVSQK